MLLSGVIAALILAIGLGITAFVYYRSSEMNRIQAVNNEKEAVANADEAERQRKKAVDNERIAKEQEREAKESANAERQAKEGEKHQRQLAEERAAIGLSRQLAAQAVQHLDEQRRSLPCYSAWKPTGVATLQKLAAA